MKKTALLLPLALLLTSLPCAAQGPLSPPGPPAPTMKTLEQIEPRTPISSLPCTISQPGSYYVVSNLHSTTDGIVIETNGASVSLMGFSITGDGGSSFPDDDDGIQQEKPLEKHFSQEKKPWQQRSRFSWFLAQIRSLVRPADVARAILARHDLLCSASSASTHRRAKAHGSSPLGQLGQQVQSSQQDK